MAETARPPSVFDRAFLTDAEDVTELLLIRHGQQVIDPNAAVSELFDPPLSEQGRLQAKLLGEAYSTKHIDAIVSSPLQRAHETALALASHHNLSVTVVKDLREVEIFRDVPSEKKLSDFLGVEMLKAVRHRMLEERSWDVYPYSESSQEFRKRAINAIEATIATHPTGRVAVVCHGGVINAYLSHIVRSPLDMFFRPAHTAVSIALAGAGRRVLSSLNDVSHLTTTEGHFGSY